MDDHGNWYHDKDYRYGYTSWYHGKPPYDYEKYNKEQDTGGGIKFRDSSEDRKKKEEAKAEDAPKKEEGKANGLPAELDPNFGKLAQKKKMKAHETASLV